MSRELNRILSKLNLDSKDRADLIKEIYKIKESGVAKATSEISAFNGHIFNDDNDNNLNIINQLSVTDNYEVYYKLSENNILKCIYYNGILTCIKDNNITQYYVNFNTGEITRKAIIYIDLIGYEVKLDVCNSGSIEADRNLELLNKAYFTLGDNFTVNIDAGIGVVKYTPYQGGKGHITTAEGVNVFYNIGEDGSVVKDREIDLIELCNIIQELK